MWPRSLHASAEKLAKIIGDLAPLLQVVFFIMAFTFILKVSLPLDDCQMVEVLNEREFDLKTVFGQQRPLKVAVHGFWKSIRVGKSWKHPHPSSRWDNLWLPPLWSYMLGVPIIETKNFSAADVVLHSAFKPPEEIEAIAERYSSAAHIFFIQEKTKSGRFTDYDDYMLHVVDGALGIHPEKKSSAEDDVSNYERMPEWMWWHVNKSCHLEAYLLNAKIDAEEWKARPKFASLVSRHRAYPRKELYALMNEVLEGEHVDAPGKAFRNMQWPKNISSSKIALLKSYRWNICPENGIEEGYVTEKVFDAHASGAIPIYWGVDPPEPQVVNPARIVHLKEPINFSALKELVRRMERDEDYRREFFAQPLWQPGAQEFVSDRCSASLRVLRRALARADARKWLLQRGISCKRKKDV